MFRILPVRNLFRPIGNHILIRRPKCRRSKLLELSYSSSRNPSKYIAQVKRTTREIFFPPARLDGVKNKIALVTGGADGIGLRCVRELLTCGAKGVMIADTNERTGYDKVVDISKEYGSEKIAFIQIIPGDYITLKNAYLSTINYFKKLDLVVNNVKFKEKNWEDQVDEYIKGIVLSTQLSLEFMGRNNGGKGGTLVNIASDYEESSESCPLFVAAQDFLIRFDRSVANEHFENSDVKVMTICKATSDSIGYDLATVISKGNNGCVWMP